MVFRHTYRGGVWVDLEQPTEEEVHEVAREFSIGERIEREVLSLSPTPLVAADADATLLVLHFPVHGAENPGGTSAQEIDFIVGERFIVTVRYEVVAPLYHLKKLLETKSLVAGKDSITTDVLLEILFAHLYTSVRDHTNHIANRLERIEQEMFAGREHTTVRPVSSINREFLHLEAALANQEEPLEHFLHALTERGMFGATFRERAERILAERTQVARLAATHRAVATELRETNNVLLEARQGSIMKTLTLITFSVLPLELLALVFGMHAQGAPLEQDPNAFWLIIGAMAVIAVGMTLFFAKKRWIF